MRTHITVALSMLTGIGIGAVAVQLFMLSRSRWCT
jgi:hypothetical protein